MHTTIKIGDLKHHLVALQNGTSEFDFFGITSNEADCIYFSYENNTFYIEFEAIVQDQVTYMDTIKAYAEQHSFSTEVLTYNNEPQYNSNQPAPVLRLITRSNLDEIANIGQEIQTEIFKNTSETTYFLIP